MIKMIIFPVLLTILGCAQGFISPKSFNSHQRDWWQTGVFYQIYPRSFRDSDGNGIGDLIGISQKIWYLKDIGVTAVALNPIYESYEFYLDYDIMNFTKVDPLLGTLADLDYLIKELHEAGIRIILDFVPNHTSEQHAWHSSSLIKMYPYTNYYIWKDARNARRGEKLPPNNWVSEMGGSMWAWSAERRQYYLHQFHHAQPDLNYRCEELVKEMMDTIKFWLDRGVDGLKMVAAPHLIEDARFRNEGMVPVELSPTGFTTFDKSRTMDQPETLRLITRFREVFDDYSTKDGKTRVMIIESFHNMEKAVEYYSFDGKPGAHMPFNFLLPSGLDGIHARANDYCSQIQKWLRLVPEGQYANWVLGNHDNQRLASKYGPDLSDGLLMIGLLLPGTANVYYGDEIGMEDAKVTFDKRIYGQDNDIARSRYRWTAPCLSRSPFQWDSSRNAGFSKTWATWVPVNTNFLVLNLKAQRKSKRNSHFKVFKRLMEIRRTETAMHGNVETYMISTHVFSLVRRLEGFETFVVVINLGDDVEMVELCLNVPDIPHIMTVHTSSTNALYSTGDNVPTRIFPMQPKASVLLTSLEAEHITSGAAEVTLSIAVLILLIFIVYVYLEQIS